MGFKGGRVGIDQDAERQIVLIATRSLFLPVTVGVPGGTRCNAQTSRWPSTGQRQHLEQTMLQQGIARLEPGNPVAWPSESTNEPLRAFACATEQLA